jgi:Ca2+-binding RTX toxin-like protein
LPGKNNKKKPAIPSSKYRRINMAVYTKITLNDAANTYAAPNAGVYYEILGLGGNDTLTGNAMDDTLDGGIGNDSLSGAAGNDSLLGRAGDDILSGGVGSDTLFGGIGNDGLWGGSLSSRLCGEAGNDTLWGYGGDDTLDGGADNDFLSGQNGNDQLFGGAGNDNCYGGNGNDVLFGDAGNDVLGGDAGNDSMYGGDGNDTYEVDSASDSIVETNSSLTQKDTVNASLSYSLGVYLENLTLLGTADLMGYGNALGNILTGNGGANQLYGEAGNDTLLGGLGNDQLFGGVGNDTLLGEGGNDALFGGDGNDRLEGGDGNDSLHGGDFGVNTLIGGLGNDIYFIENAGDIVTELSGPGSGTDSVFSFFSYTLAANCESLSLEGGSAINGTGNALDNSLSGNDATNVIKGLGGNDVLWGEGGNDILDGGEGNDTLRGGVGDDTYYITVMVDMAIENAGEGNDTIYAYSAAAGTGYALGVNDENLILTGMAENGIGNDNTNIMKGNNRNNNLYGGEGNDTLFGGAGLDTLTGWADQDIFVFDTALNKTTNVDTITDFSVVNDTIWLDKTIFAKLTLGVLTAANFCSGTGVAGDANDYILYNTTTGALSYDKDGSGASVAIQFATLTGSPDTITAADFVVIA